MQFLNHTRLFSGLTLLLVCLTATAQNPAPSNLKDALVSGKWSWIKGSEKQPLGEITFDANGSISRTWAPGAVWKWEAVDKDKFAIVADMKKRSGRFVFTFDPSFAKFQTNDFFGLAAAGSRLPAAPPTVASVTSTPPPATPVAMQKPPVVPARSTPAAPASPVARATPTPPKAPSLRSPDGRSQLANFWTQIPNTAAWAHSSLDLTAPTDLLDMLTMFKHGLVAESAKSSREMQKAYTRAVLLTDQLGGTVIQRTQILMQATGGTGKNPPAAAIAQWAGLANSQRMQFRSPRAILDEAVFAGGGLGKTTPLINSSFPLAVLPPAPDSAKSPDFAAVPAWVRCGGDGPSGTNFGWGDRHMKVAVSVNSNSDVPIPVKVETYWIGWDGKHHNTGLADRRNSEVSGTRAVGFEVGNVVLRTNGQTYGVLTANLGVYRGWLIVLRDRGGKKIGSAANVVEFNKLVD